MGIGTYSHSRCEYLPGLPSPNRFHGCIGRCSPIISSSIWCLLMCEGTDKLEELLVLPVFPVI